MQAVSPEGETEFPFQRRELVGVQRDGLAASDQHHRLSAWVKDYAGHEIGYAQLHPKTEKLPRESHEVNGKT